MSIPLFAPAQVRAMDARAIAGGTSEDALMERAAGYLARAVVGQAGRGYGLRVGIVCGKGNNGGDGLAAARRLLDAGAHATVCVVEGDAALSGLPATQLARWKARGGKTVAEPAAAIRRTDVIVDCLLGTGTAGAPREPYASAVATIEAARSRGTAVVACDQPTGVDAATGAVPGAAVRADLTVTLGAEKIGLRVWPARGYCGRIVLGDLGILAAEDAPAAHALDDRAAAALLPPLDPMAHKRSRGVVVIVGGSQGMSGAAVLAARGAHGAGAGLVTVCTDERARPAVAAAFPEILTEGLPADDADAAYEAVAAQCERADALALGPGLGRSDAARRLVRRLVADIDIPLVLDADGLNAFAGASDALPEHRSPLLVLTPHAGEYARLSESVWQDRVAQLPKDAARWCAAIVAKGPGTLTALPDERLWVNRSGGPGLATGGTGDVLTGMLGALLAADADPDRIAAAVHLHGLAGQEAARRTDPRSVTAGLVADTIPRAWRILEAAR